MDGLSAASRRQGRELGLGSVGLGDGEETDPLLGDGKGLCGGAGPAAAQGLLGVHNSAFGTGSCLRSRPVPARRCSRILSRSARRGSRPPGLPSPVPASCHPQFHMSLFSLTFSNNPKNM